MPGSLTEGVELAELAREVFEQMSPTYSLHCGSFFGLPVGILNIELVKPKKELQIVEQMSPSR